MNNSVSQELLKFLQKSPTAFHAVQQMKSELLAVDFTELKENQRWNIECGKHYFVTRNDSSLIAFTIPENGINKMHILTSHSDSPTFKIKENPEIEVEKHYVKLNVEKYGGMLCAPWFDRPLSVAGRVIIKDKTNRQFTSKLVNIDRDLVMIRGASEEFISSGRLDDLQCAFASLQGFLSGEKRDCMAVHCVLDNEEVGSGTKQGAASTFLFDTLIRVHEALGYDGEDYRVHLADSFMISADNAHAVHPNYTEKADPTNRPYLNEGIVLKFNANQKYCTDAVSAAMFRDLCKRADVPVQTFTNRSDMAGGSTLGNISNTQVALNTVDIGLPQLAMHSPYETAGVKDTEYLVRAAKEFFC
ncbi:MAG: M18 family aminopeptidase [Clostridiales bacterium]|nr:M18 family aminopeptidase [Clostridiales bacterium]